MKRRAALDPSYKAILVRAIVHLISYNTRVCYKPFAWHFSQFTCLFVLMFIRRTAGIYF